MKIKKEDREEIKVALTKWAKANKMKLREDGDSFRVEKGSVSIEVIPEDGWAYVHCQGRSTNIETIDEFGDAVNRIKGDN